MYSPTPPDPQGYVGRSQSKDAPAKMISQIFLRWICQITHQKILGRLALLWVLQQTGINEVLRFFRVSSLGRQPWCRLVDDVLQQLQDAHRHPSALQADTLALPLVLLRFLLLRPARSQETTIRNVVQRQGSHRRRRECPFQIRVRVIVGVALRKREATKRDLDQRDTKGPDVGLDGVLRALYPFRLYGCERCIKITAKVHSRSCTSMFRRRCPQLS